MKIDELRDTLAAAWRPYYSTAVAAYMRADEDLPHMLEARKTKWAVCTNNGNAILVYDTYEEAENHCGLGHVMPYKEPKP